MSAVLLRLHETAPEHRRFKRASRREAEVCRTRTISLLTSRKTTMQSLLRVGARLPLRHRLASSLLVPQSTTIRNAHSSYGDKQSGHPEGSDSKSTSHLEHPGPDPPNTGSSASKSGSKGTTHSSGSSDKGSPAIHSPQSAAEKDDPEVRKHNEEMRQRHERSVNQLSEDDNKVDKQFWTGRQNAQAPKEWLIRSRRRRGSEEAIW
jgi:hypothetical protein